MKSSEEILAEAEDFLRTEVAPAANDIDMDPDALRTALDGLCDRNLMALRRPAEYGGPALSEPDFRRFQEAVARYSGSLAFLQTQHQSAVSMISKGDNDGLKERLLPLMGDGRRLVGIGFSQLRRPGDPIMKAEPQENGNFILNGKVPWVTGWTYYHDFLIGASLPDGRAVFGVVPFRNEKKDGGEIKFSGVMRLAAMESPQTVSADLTNWRLDAEDVTFIKPAGWIQNNDMINVTLQGFFALGCARAGLDVMQEAYERRHAEFIKTAMDALEAELEQCRDRMTQMDDPLEERLETRAWAIDLAARCAHAGVASSSGAANSVKHRAQRVYREALVYTVSAQTASIMEATLKRLVRRGDAPANG